MKDEMSTASIKNYALQKGQSTKLKAWKGKISIFLMLKFITLRKPIFSYEQNQTINKILLESKHRNKRKLIYNNEN